MEVGDLGELEMSVPVRRWQLAAVLLGVTSVAFGQTGAAPLPDDAKAEKAAEKVVTPADIPKPRFIDVTVKVVKDLKPGDLKGVQVIVDGGDPKSVDPQTGLARVAVGTGDAHTLTVAFPGGTCKRTLHAKRVKEGKATFVLTFEEGTGRCDFAD